MRFSERVRPPLGWWVLAVLFALSMSVAIGYYLGIGWALGAGVGSLVVVGLGFRTASYATTVDDVDLVVGRAVIGREWIGGAVPLDPAAARARAGVDADARAHLVLRPWITGAVEVTLADPADPVPYWMVSTRRPRALATALGWEPVPEAGRPVDEASRG